MKRALRLAARATGMTSPNPMVGAVIVKNGRIIAEDYHKRAGEPHAEALALTKAGKEAHGSTLYVSLEPCCHTEKRTPPCTKAIIASKIKRVVIGQTDPNPKVSGRGIEELKNAGIEVKIGVLGKEAATLNEAYSKFIKTKMPFVIMKVAMTLDGKIATPHGQSKWITSEKSRLLVHKLRSASDAVLTAIGTVKADDPELTARIKGGKNPIRIVIDPMLQIPIPSKILKTPPDTIIVTKKNNQKKKNLEKSGIKFILFKEKLDLKWLMSELGKVGIMSVLVEGGSSLTAHCLEDGIVDKAMFFIAPKIIGGRGSYPAVGGRVYRSLENPYLVEGMRVRRIGEDILIEGYVRY